MREIPRTWQGDTAHDLYDEDYYQNANNKS